MILCASYTHELLFDSKLYALATRCPLRLGTARAATTFPRRRPPSNAREHFPRSTKSSTSVIATILNSAISAFARAAVKWRAKLPSGYIRENLVITTSDVFSLPPLQRAMLAFGVECIVPSTMPMSSAAILNHDCNRFGNPVRVRPWADRCKPTFGSWARLLPIFDPAGLDRRTMHLDRISDQRSRFNNSSRREASTDPQASAFSYQSRAIVMSARCIWAKLVTRPSIPSLSRTSGS